MDLGSRIQTLRKKAGLSQEALADALGISRQALSKWESGASLPTLENLMQLSKLFDISLDELITGEAPTAEQVSPQEAAVRQETLETLLQHLEDSRNTHRSSPWLTGLLLGLSAITLAVGVYAGVRTAAMQDEIQLLHQRIDSQNSTISSISHNLLSQLESAPQESADYSFDYELTGYDREKDQLELFLRVTPREYHADDVVEFLLTPHPGGMKTLEEAIVITAELQNGQYVAKVAIPAVEDIEIYLRRENTAGDTVQEKIGAAYNMATDIIPRLAPDGHTFTFRRGNGILTVNGAPSIYVQLPESDPRGTAAKLICTLRYGDELIYTKDYDLAEEWGVHTDSIEDSVSSDTAAEILPVGGITFYLDSYEYNENEYVWHEDTKLEWEFLLVYDDGETYRETLSWVP